MRDIIRQAAKIIIKENLGKSWCPGEDGCLKLETAESVAVCETCPKNLSKSKLFAVEDVGVILPWLSHLFYLYGLVKVGAHFLIDDLTRKEWDGLLMLESIRNEVEQERYEAERIKEKAEAAIAKSKYSRR